MLPRFNLGTLPALLFWCQSTLQIQAEEVAADAVRRPGFEPLLAQAGYPRGLKEENLRDLPLTDPRLRVAYHFLIRNAYASGPVMDERSPEMLAVLRDVKRRGDSATPLWLDIMAKNPNTELECYIPWILRRIGAVQMAPYVDYCRTMVKKPGA